MTLTGLAIRTLLPPRCPICRQGSPDGQSAEGGPCPDCSRSLALTPPGSGSPPPGLAWVASAFRHEGLPRRALTAFKFERRIDLAGPLVALLVSRIGSRGEIGRIVPVPASRIGRRLRGFDPAAMIATELAARLGSEPPLRGGLSRVGFGSQRGLDRRDRFAGADRFEAAGRIDGPVVLVDDVMTTGATLSACARAVAAAGAGPVGGLTLTRRR